MPAFDPERAAMILLDALTMGDGKAAEKWGCTTRTVENHRQRLTTDPGFSAFFRHRHEAASRGWSSVRLKFLRKAIAKLEELVDKAGPDQIRDVSEAVKTVGELQVVSDALNVGDSTSPAGNVAPQDGDGGPGAATPLIH